MSSKTGVAPMPKEAQKALATQIGQAAWALISIGFSDMSDPRRRELSIEVVKALTILIAAVEKNVLRRDKSESVLWGRRLTGMDEKQTRAVRDAMTAHLRKFD